jgi:hypothetical protein
MNAPADILARQDPSALLELVVIVIVIGLSAIGSIIQKRLSAKEEQREREYDAERRREVEEDRQAGRRHGEAAPHAQLPQRPRPVRRPATRPPWLVSVPPETLPSATPPAAPSAEAAPSVVHRRRSAARVEPVAPKLVRQSDRLGRMIDLDQAERATHKAMTTAQPVEDIDREAVEVALDNPAAARMAIIYQEILGPPKSLRREPTGWWEM